MKDASTGSTPSDRRQATVLFADLAGFTSWSQRTDPEDVAETINGCFEIIERVVLEHGGSVDKFIGDCAMALFGAPRALEDAPRQAVNSAIRIRNELVQFVERHGLAGRIHVHVGINTGLVVAGDIGGEIRRDYTVMGPTVNLASRLLNVASAGEIIVGPATYRYTRRDFEYRATKPLQLKGIDDSTVAYELLTREEQRYRSAPIKRDSPQGTAMVGREQQLARIDACFRDVTEGRGSIVSLVADTGMGKSRLVAEARALASARELAIYEGRALSMGSGLSFHPFVDLIQHWAKIPASDDDAHASHKLMEAIRSVCADRSQDVFPPIATLMGYDLDRENAARLAGIEGDALEKLIRRTMRLLLEAIADQAPIVLVFEDLHWADQSSLGVLEAILPLAAERRVMIVIAARPQIEATSERILKRVRETLSSHHVDLTLEPLGGHQCEALITDLLGVSEVPHDLLRVVAQKTEGNPFYVEEVVRSLLDTGGLAVDKGRITTTARLHTLEIPGTIEEVVMTRVDRLSESCRRLLQVGSVLGRRFQKRILVRLLPEYDNLDADLQELIAKRFLNNGVTRETASRRRAMLRGEVEYSFKHATIQEAVYESLLKKTRRDLHARCAEVFEDIFANRLQDAYGVLAYHWSRADRLDKAEEYLFKAGEEATRTAASSEALQYFQEAYRVYLMRHGDQAEDAKKAVLERNIGVALLNTGALSESVDHFNAALRLWGIRVPESDLALRLQLAVDLPVSLFHLYFGSTDRARRPRPNDLDIYATMYNRCRAQNPTDPKRSFFDNLTSTRYLHRVDPARVEGAVGMYAANGAFFAFAGLSVGAGRRFLAAAERLIRPDRPTDQFQFRAMATVLDFHAGDWSGVHDIDDELLDQALRTGLLWDADIYLGMVCERDLRQGKFVAAHGHLEKITNLRHGYGYDFSQSTESAMTAYLALEQRRLDEAREAMQAYHDSRHEAPLRVFGLSGLARIDLLDGRFGAAQDALGHAEEIINRSGLLPAFYYGAFCNSVLLAEVLALESGKGNAGAARKAAARAVATSKKIARERTEAHRLAARMFWHLGQKSKARRSWTRALEEGERLGAAPEVGRIYADIARCLDKSESFQDRDTAAWAALAEERFDALGLTWDRAQTTEEVAAKAAESRQAAV